MAGRCLAFATVSDGRTVLGYILHKEAARPFLQGVAPLSRASELENLHGATKPGGQTASASWNCAARHVVCDCDSHKLCLQCM
jgi:hypothetical protein